MNKLILKAGVIAGVLLLPIGLAVASSPARLMLADNDQATVKKTPQEIRKEREELRKKQMEERKAKEEQRRKEMAERKAQMDQKKAEHEDRGKHKGKDEHADNDRHKGRDDHRDRDRRKDRIDRGDKSKPAANVAAPLAPAAKPAAAPKPAAAAQAPLVVKTYPASGVIGRGATLNAYSSFPGKTVRMWFEWGNSPSFGQSTASETFTGEKSVSQKLAVPAGRGKKYYYRAVAESSGQLVYGETMTFVTP